MRLQNKRRTQNLEPIEEARLAVEAAGDKQASDIVLLDTREICGFADYFVICSAESSKQIQAVSEEIEAKLKKTGAKLLHSEGSMSSGWVLLDYGSLVIHIFSPEQRVFYRLETLWNSANMVLRIQ
jgi:ribosome-associated protein